MPEIQETFEPDQPTTTLKDVISRKIATLPIVEPQDLYRRSGGVPIEMPFDVREGADGELKFGKRYESRRVVLGDCEVMYVDPREQYALEGKAIIHFFAPSGGLMTRITYATNMQGRMNKHYQLPPWAALSHGSWFRTECDAEEQKLVLGALDEPEQSADILMGLQEISDREARLLAENQEAYARRQARFLEALRQITEAERSAW